jgi:hypothetical protein
MEETSIMEPKGKKIGRRMAFKGLTMAAVGATALSQGLLAGEQKKKATSCCEDQALPAQSVFNTVCNKASADKYKNGDNPVVYRLGAMWLMLLTEDWSKYFDHARETEFLTGLAAELKLNLVDVKELWRISQVKANSFTDIRTSWMNLTSNAGLYGARPCQGGKSILTIACLDPNDESGKLATAAK